MLRLNGVVSCRLTRMAKALPLAYHVLLDPQLVAINVGFYQL